MSQPVTVYRALINSMGGDLGVSLGSIGGGNTPASAAWPASNDALFVPFTLPQATLIKRLFVVNGAAVSGNIDVGIYSESGARIVSTGSTAQSGTSTLQFFDITDLVIGPGRFYLAVALDNTTGTLFRASLTVPRAQALGLAKQATAFALPATATFATMTAGYLPLMGAEVVRVL
jgi:hypothetical protein